MLIASREVKQLRSVIGSKLGVEQLCNHMTRSALHDEVIQDLSLK